MQSPTSPALQDRLAVTNLGRLAGEAALLEDRLSVYRDTSEVSRLHARAYSDTRSPSGAGRNSGFFARNATISSVSR